MIRKGKNFYVENYKKAIELYSKGYSIKDIASILGISYSACYAWIFKKRIPKKDIATKFYEFLKVHGPSPIIEIKKEFSKHSDVYLEAKERGFKIMRYRLPRILKGYSIWYYLEGQEKELINRVKDIINKREELKEKLAEEIFKNINLVV
ncbi:MAG: helix-turn-helix domain-containing protein [Candidatus Aenigmatarchaeota archaeon]